MHFHLQQETEGIRKAIEPSELLCRSLLKYKGNVFIVAGHSFSEDIMDFFVCVFGRDSTVILSLCLFPLQLQSKLRATLPVVPFSSTELGDHEHISVNLCEQRREFRETGL